MFDSTYRKDASVPAQELGAGLRPRLVFGWTAFRELLHADALGLSPVLLELLKLVLLRMVPNPPMDNGTELRLIGGTDTGLEFGWVEGPTEKYLSGLSVPWEVCHGIEVDHPNWATLRNELAGALFVDYRRLFME